MILIYVIYIFSLLQLHLVSSIDWDSGCGNTTGCFPNCPHGCKYLVTWQQTPGGVRFTVQAEIKDHYTSSYVAIGFSKDRRMGDDSGIFCRYYYDIERFHNEGLRSYIQWNLTGITADTSFTNNVYSFSFTRTNDYVSDPTMFDLKYHYIIMVVIGELGDYNRLGKHYMIPWMSDTEVNFLENRIVDEYKLNSPLVKLHGIMMVIAWLLLSTLGIFTARYNKRLMSKKNINGERVWFQIHRCVMLTMVACVCVGIIAIFVENKGYSQITPTKMKVVVKWHPIIGIIVAVLCFINPVMAFFRPDKEHKQRWIFNWAHFVVGILTQFLAVATVLLGYYQERAKIQTAVYVTVGHLLVTVMFFVAMEVRKNLFDKDLATSEKDSNEDFWTFPNIALLTFSMVSFGCSLTSVVLIGYS